MTRAYAQPDYSQDLALPPVLLIGDTPNARARGRSTLDASDFDEAATLTVEEAAGDLGRVGRLSAIWIEIEDAPTAAGQQLLGRLGSEARRLGAGVIVSTRIGHLDEILLWLGTSDVELLVDAGDIERLGALTLAASRLNKSLGESSNEATRARLRQLSEEVSRIAASLARLSSAAAQPPLSPSTMAPPRDDVPSVSAEQLRALIRARRLRSNYLPADLFAEPAWDMLLDLLQAEVVQHRVPVSSLCIAAAVPATTALRWIKAMTERNLLVRRDDPHDGRRVFIEMAPATSASLRHYFKEVGMVAL